MTPHPSSRVILAILLLVVAFVRSSPCGVNITASPTVAIAPLDEFNTKLYQGWSPFGTPLTLSSATPVPRLQAVAINPLDGKPITDAFSIGLGFISDNSTSVFVNITVRGAASGRATLPASTFLPSGEWQLVAFFVALPSSGTMFNFSTPLLLLPENITVLDTTTVNASTVPGIVRFNDDGIITPVAAARPQCVVVGGKLRQFTVEVVDSALSRLFVAPAAATCVATLSTATGTLQASGTRQVNVSSQSTLVCTFYDVRVRQFGVGAVLRVVVSLGGVAIGSVTMPLLITRFATPQCYLAYSYRTPSWLYKTSTAPALTNGALLPPLTVELFASDGTRSASAGLIASVSVYFEDGTLTTVAAAVPVVCGTALFESIKVPMAAPTGSLIQFVVSVPTPLGDLSVVSRQILVAPASQSQSLAFALLDGNNPHFPYEGAGTVVDATARIAEVKMFFRTSSGPSTVANGGSGLLISPLQSSVASCTVVTGYCSFKAVTLPVSGVYRFALFNAAGRALPVIVTGPVQVTSQDGAVRATFAPWGSLFTREFQRSFTVLGSPLPPIRILLYDRFGAIVRSENQIVAVASTIDGLLSSSIAAAIGGEIVFSGLTMLSCAGFCNLDIYINSVNMTLSSGPIFLMDDDATGVAAVQFSDSGGSFLRSTFSSLSPILVTPGASGLSALEVDLVLPNHLPALNTTATSSVTCSIASNVTSMPAVNGSASFPTIPYVPASIPSWDTLLCCLDPTVSAVQRCASATLISTASPISKIYVSDPVASTSASGVPQEILSASVVCGSSLCTTFPSSNLTLSAATTFTTSLLIGVPNYSQSVAIQQGLSDMLTLSFGSSADLPAEKGLSITFTSSIDPTVTGGSSLFTVGTVPPNAQNVLDLFIALPPAAFSAQVWINSFALFLALDPSRIHLRRVVQSYFSDTGLIWTRLEMAVGQPTAVLPQLLSTAALTSQIMQLTPTCQNQHLSLALVSRHSSVSTRCDSAFLSEMAESSLHCEIFRGPNARCSCFLNLIYTLGDACVQDPQLVVVCAHLGSCNDGKIKSVCSLVQANIPLQVFFVVGGTALGLVILFALCRVRQAPKLATRVFVHKNAQNVLARKGKADDAIFS